MRQNEPTATLRQFPFQLVDASGNRVSSPTVTFTNPPASGEVRISKAGGAFSNVTGSVIEIGSGNWAYQALVADTDTIGNVLIDVNKAGCRPTTVGATVDKEDVNIVSLGSTALNSIAAAILDKTRSDHVDTGSVGEGIALAAALLQGNFYMDNVNNSNPNGQTSARLRAFHDGTDAAAATSGGTGEGEFATFVITTTYVGLGKIDTHRSVQQ